MWGDLCEQDLLRDTVIVSDGAGQFRLGHHAGCWVHAERLVYKLQPTNAAERRAVEIRRGLIWWLRAFFRDPLPIEQRASTL